ACAAAALIFAGSAVLAPVAAQDKDPTRRDIDAYRLRVGDEVQIVVSNGNKVTPEIDRKVIVPGNGEVSIPPIGKVHLADRTLDEVQQTITQKLNVDDILERGQEQQNGVVFENDIIIVPRLENANPQSADWVYVLGKVRNAGRQPIIKGKNAFTLTKLVAMCGDFQEFADRTKVK